MTTRICIALSLMWILTAHAQAQPAEVMLFGVFHFANPGRDVVRVDQVDVSTRANQTYLDGLAQRLCDFLINEIYQVGFRVAKACGVEKIYGFDESEIGWDAEPLFEYLEKSAPDLLDALNAETAQLHAKDFYLFTNAAGAGLDFEGADATARWWHRNFRMYANIQRYAMAGERVLVVAGQGHTAILRDLLGIDRRITARDIRAYL